MPANFWPIFAALYIPGLISVLCVMPYMLAITKDARAKATKKLPLPVLLLLSFVQSGILLALATGAGILIAKHIGIFKSLIVESLVTGRFTASASLWQALATAVVVGVVLALAAGLIERFVFAPYNPPGIREITGAPTMLQSFLASFYGGIGEELLMRLFLLSLVAWPLSLIFPSVQPPVSLSALWAANIIVAIIFGLGHLPATAAVTKLTPRIVTRALVLNGLVGLGCGYLFWQYGIEAAIVAHFSADIVLHVFGEPWMRRYYQANKA